MESPCRSVCSPAKDALQLVTHSLTLMDDEMTQLPIDFCKFLMVNVLPMMEFVIKNQGAIKNDGFDKVLKSPKIRTIC